LLLFIHLLLSREMFLKIFENTSYWIKKYALRFLDKPFVFEKSFRFEDAYYQNVSLARCKKDPECTLEVELFQAAVASSAARVCGLK